MTAYRDLRRGQLVEVDDRGIFSASTEPNWQRAIIVDLLSHQFTCTILHNKSHTFRFYKDRENTWRFKP